MKHKKYKQLLELSIMGELDLNEQKILDTHLKECKECQAEIESFSQMIKVINAQKNNKVDDELLFAARNQLKGALSVVRSKNNLFSKASDSILNFFTTPLRFAMGSALLIAIGILIGSFILSKSDVNEIVTSSNGSNDFISLDEKVRFTNVNFIDSDPSDGQVEFTFDAVKPVYVKGSVTDPKIQTVLTYSMLNEQNPGSRLNSINAMDTEVPMIYDADIQDALITVVMADENPGVRREALKLLQKVSYTEQVKEAFLFVLTSDPNSGNRIEALNALIDAGSKGYKLDNNQIQLIKQKVETENNYYIKSKAKTILQEYN